MNHVHENVKKRKTNGNPSTQTGEKKKRKRLSREELHAQNVEIRYSKLVNKAAKLLRKEAKVCKTFECQKIIRKIKAIKKSLVDDDDNSSTKKDDKNDAQKIINDESEQDAVSKINRKVHNLEEKLKMTKSLELDDVVNVCFKRLGLDPAKAAFKNVKGSKLKPNKDEVEENEEESRLHSNDQSVKEFDTKLIETILKHKKMISVVDSVSAFATEHNRWLAREEEWLRSGGKKKSSKQNAKYKKSDLSAHTTDSGLFIDSLAGGDGDENDDDILNEYAGFGQEGEGNDDEYDYEMYTDAAPTKKKNRVGQRVRKARAMALEAKEEGKPYDKDSFNKKWWELQPKNPKRNASGLDASKKVDASQVVAMGSNWKEVGKTHPSWAARQVQKSKSGIEEFKGKKITFD